MMTDPLALNILMLPNGSICVNGRAREDWIVEPMICEALMAPRMVASPSSADPSALTVHPATPAA